ncbi:MAG: phosphomannomutase/phosphoglucomutase [Pseudomonadota bacterium]
MIGKKKKAGAKGAGAAPDSNGTQITSGAAPSKRNSQGVGIEGDAVRRTMLIGFALALLPALLGLAYLFLISAPARQSALLNRVADGFAEEQAQLVSASMANLSQRVQSAAQAREVQLSITRSDVADTADVEAALLAYFPDAVSLRLIPLNALGTADLDAGLGGLRNHIEVDLVRRISNNEPAPPEAYQVEGRWLSSLAQLATRPDVPERSVVVLITLDEQFLGGLLTRPDPMPGRFTLRQRIYGELIDRDAEIVARGTGVEAYARSASVPNTPWQVVFSPSQDLVAGVSRTSRPSYEVVLMIVGFAAGALLFVMIRSRKLLEQETQRILDAAEHRTQVLLKIPELLPLARDLRRVTLRKSRPEPASSKAEAQVAAEAGTAMAGVEGPAATELPAHIFRAYDIRGIADRDLDDETIYRIGSAIATIAGEMGEQTLALGYDGRASSARIRGLLEKALQLAGRDVVDIGLVPTPLLYFTTQRSEATSGIMITGSHNPPEYNGLKIVLKGQTLAEGGIDRVRKLAQSGNFSKGTGHMAQRSMVSAYLDEVVSDIAIAVPLKIVVDAGNGATSHIAPSLLEELGCEVVPLYCEVDGSFPNRKPDTGDESALSGLVAAVAEHQADFGVAYDGDGDRIAVVSGSGRILRTDMLMMLFARDVVTRHPGADVVYDVKCSRNLAQLITGLGGRPVLWKTGHALMKQKMAETGALLGGEFSGHIFFGERWYGFDDGMYATGRLAEIISSQDLSLDDYIADLPDSVSTPEILIPVSDEEKFELVERFKREAQFSGGKSNDLDGLRVDFHEGWGLLRASNTGPNLTARFEANDDSNLEKIKKQFSEQLAAVAPDLKIPF